MCKSSVELGLVYKTFVNKTLEKLHCCPRKTIYILCSRNGGFFWEAEQGYLSLTTKNTLVLETFFPSESRAASLPIEARWWARSRSRSGRCVHGARSSGRNAHIRSSTVVYVIKNNDRKKLSETCTNPEVRFLAQKYSVIRPIFFFKLCPCLAWESNSLTM